jgi:hypothetical protein
MVKNNKRRKEDISFHVGWELVGRGGGGGELYLTCGEDNKSHGVVVQKYIS